MSIDSRGNLPSLLRAESIEEQALNGFPPGQRPSATALGTGPQRTAPTEKATVLRRQHERRSAAITALVHCHGRFQTVSILDISAGGLQLQGAFGVTGGDRIEIELLSGHRLTAKVAWSMGSRIGAAFSPPLAPDHPGLVALQRSAGGSPDTPADTREK
jgi:hypothetical protein